MDFTSGSLIASFGLAIIVAIVVAIANSTGQGPTMRDRLLSSPILAPTLIIHYFLPYALIVLVFFMDVMSQLPQAIWSLVIAITLFLINAVIGKQDALSTATISDLCEIPGLKGMSSSFVPQSLLFVSTIVFYLASFVTVSSQAGLAQTSTSVSTGTGLLIPTSAGVTTMTPSPSARIGASWGLAMAVVVFQAVGILSTPGCLTNMTVPFTAIPLPSWASALLAVIIGGAFGGGLAVPIAGWSITQPSYSVTSTAGAPVAIPANINQPSSTSAKGPGFVRERFQLGAGLGEGSMPQATAGPQGDMPIDAAKPGGSDDQFVCEAYKNGQLVSSTLTE